jgi:phosphoribosylformylglycinamidine cyclo-ligase
MPSNGLHTNGYSLARKIFGESRSALSKRYPGLDRPVGEVLMEPHRCYYKELKPLLPLIRGLAHITGGGLLDNVPRILPEGLAIRFESKKWPVPPIFPLMQKMGKIEREEMYHVFNMGIGMVVVSAPQNLSKLKKQLPEIMAIGEVKRQGRGKRIIIE